MSDSNEKSNVKNSDPPSGAEANSGMAVANNNNGSSSSSSSSSIRLVVQRYRKASLLIDEKQVVTVGGDGGSSSSSSLLLTTTGHSEMAENSDNTHIGMLVYVSFSKTAVAQDLTKAARTILNLPIHTEGGWGDGSATKSIVQVAAEATRTSLSNDNETKTTSTTEAAAASSTVSILLVPQANIIAKVKKNGKSIQYRDQIDKNTGEKLYHGFCQMVEELLLEEQQNQNTTNGGTRAAAAANTNNTSNKGNKSSKGNGPAVPASVLPKDYFRCLQEQQQEQLYGSFDPSTGLPLTTADGQALTKSARKRVQKLYTAHRNRHEKYLASNPKPQQDQQQQSQEQDTNDTPSETTNTPSSSSPRLDPSFVQLVTGSFGKRQGLELVSDMGPFCHVIDI